MLFIIIDIIIIIEPPTHRWSCVVEEHRLNSYHPSSDNNNNDHNFAVCTLTRWVVWMKGGGREKKKVLYDEARTRLVRRAPSCCPHARFAGQSAMSVVWPWRRSRFISLWDSSLSRWRMVSDRRGGSELKNSSRHDLVLFLLLTRFSLRCLINRGRVL